jgi:hypothetical protein
MIIRFDSEGNEAFKNGNQAAEVATILREIVTKVESGRTSGNIKDSNGNHVGKWAMKEVRGGR